MWALCEIGAQRSMILAQSATACAKFNGRKGVL